MLKNTQARKAIGAMSGGPADDIRRLANNAKGTGRDHRRPMKALTGHSPVAVACTARIPATRIALRAENAILRTMRKLLHVALDAIDCVLEKPRLAKVVNAVCGRRAHTIQLGRRRLDVEMAALRAAAKRRRPRKRFDDVRNQPSGI